MAADAETQRVLDKAGRSSTPFHSTRDSNHHLQPDNATLGLKLEQSTGLGSRRIKCTVYIGLSLDGYIAKADGDIDWLDQPRYKLPDDEDCGYHALMASVDALVMGRNTFDKVLTFGDWPYTKPVVVLTSRDLVIRDALADKVDVESGPPQEVVDRLSTRGYRHLYIDGGATVQRFLLAGCIDRLILTQLPTLLGGGIPLFGELPEELPLKLIESRSYPNGFVQSTYTVEPFLGP